MSNTKKRVTATETPDALTVLRREEGDLRGQIERNTEEAANLRRRLEVVNGLLAKCDPEYLPRCEGRWQRKILFGL